MRRTMFEHRLSTLCLWFSGPCSLCDGGAGWKILSFCGGMILFDRFHTVVIGRHYSGYVFGAHVSQSASIIRVIWHLHLLWKRVTIYLFLGFPVVAGCSKAKRTRSSFSSRAGQLKAVDPIKHRPLHPIAGNDWQYTGPAVVLQSSKAKSQQSYSKLGL